MSSALQNIWKYTSWTLRIGCCVHFIHSQFYEVCETQGESMLPTLNYAGDIVHINKRSQCGKDCSVGDMVVALKPTDPTQRVCKRITGMPGDIIQVDPSSLYERDSLAKLFREKERQMRNGDKEIEKEKETQDTDDNAYLEDEGMDMDFDIKNIHTKLHYREDAKAHHMEAEKHLDEDEDDQAVFIKIPAGHCWLTGDNLSRSLDSRTYGVLPLGLIKGKVIVTTAMDGTIKVAKNNLINSQK